MDVSLNKYISSTGKCSRREADKLIEQGRVRINGVVARKGNRVNEGDEVTLDNKPLNESPEEIIIIFHKPAGVTTTTFKGDIDNIIDYINFPKRIFPIGRLDKPSTGLLLLTNNGDLVNKILRREFRHEKEYIVTVNKPITGHFIDKMQHGIPILGQITQKCTVERLGRFKFRIVLTQGLNRQIRRMCEFLNYDVLTLKRTRIMHLELGDLKPGAWRYLTDNEYRELKDRLEKGQ